MIEKSTVVNKLAVALGVTEAAAENLVKAGFSTVESLDGVTAEQLTAVDQIGTKVAERILNKLETSGSVAGDEKQVSQLVEILSISDDVAQMLILAGFASVESMRGLTVTDLKSVGEVSDSTAERIVLKVQALTEKVVKTVVEGEKPHCFGDYPTTKSAGSVCRCCIYHVECKVKSQ